MSFNNHCETSQNVRWLCLEVINENKINALFLKFWEMDEFLSRFPQVFLTDNSYYFLWFANKFYLAKGFSGFIDQLEKSYYVKDFSVTIEESEEIAFTENLADLRDIEKSNNRLLQWTFNKSGGVAPNENEANFHNNSLCNVSLSEIKLINLSLITRRD